MLWATWTKTSIFLEFTVVFSAVSWHLLKCRPADFANVTGLDPLWWLVRTCFISTLSCWDSKPLDHIPSNAWFKLKDFLFLFCWWWRLYMLVLWWLVEEEDLTIWLSLGFVAWICVPNIMCKYTQLYTSSSIQSILSISMFCTRSDPVKVT